MIIARILVEIFGGVWNVKYLSSNSRFFILRKLYRNIYFLYLYSRGSYIGPNTIFESIPFFPHGQSGIHISDNSYIGRDCVIFQQVTIGSNDLPDSKQKGSPIIGRNCYIGAGAMIIGNVKIGDNVKIGANCVVVKDVPDNAVVVSQPVRIITKDDNQTRDIS